MKTVTLYRPTGPNELALVEASGFKRWPPRLPEQPIFYPVCNEDYARQIARDWNVKDSGVGYVTRFDVDAEYLSQFNVEIVGGKKHAEYWIPAERLEEFNDHIVGDIEVIATYRDE
ncbi:hypothetical protein O5O45_25590 [Hahella aquimaris]|uniref:hypothetical protein n=1 Tax=Hahella sp. HNIBRBA332 TaxID=3015983 RepID=UPI00273B9DBE|nr:hypothetical protein [Hahella sp. HNIBRBA332]WLQ13106.1 hypothetical protein O5O45_25590 [Hahella sp. HNIBRBA332]